MRILEEYGEIKKLYAKDDSLIIKRLWSSELGLNTFFCNANKNPFDNLEEYGEIKEPFVFHEKLKTAWSMFANLSKNFD